MMRAVPPDLEKLLNQQESLREVIESISSELELRPLLTNITRYACELLCADRGSIGLVDASRGVIRTEAVYQMPEGELGAEMSLGVGLAGQVWQSRQAVMLSRYGELSQPTQLGLLDDAVIGMPIYWHGAMIGFFGIGAGPPHRFDEQDVATLSLFARHAAVAIVNARLFGEQERSLDEMQLLLETSQRISVAMDVRGVIEAYLAQVATRRRYSCSVVIFELDEAGERQEIIILGRWTPERGLRHLNEHHAYFRDGFDALLDTGQTVTIADIETDPRVSVTLREAQRSSGRPALALIPLLVREHRIGLVSLNHPEVHDWSEADLRPYQITAAQLATAIDSRMQQERFSDHTRQLAVLEERHRLARELHDSVTQLLFSIMLIAQSVSSAWQRDPSEAERRIGRLLELSQAARVEMRALLAELHSAEVASQPMTALSAGGRLRQDGLIGALRAHVAEFAQEDLAIDLEIQDYAPQTPEREEALYRIAQEALHNIVKHAHAKSVKIRLWSLAGSSHLSIQDDGVGFSQTADHSGRELGTGFGLNTMRERAEALGGRFYLSSTPAAGTTLEVVVPGPSPTLDS